MTTKLKQRHILLGNMVFRVAHSQHARKTLRPWGKLIETSRQHAHFHNTQFCLISNESGDVTAEQADQGTTIILPQLQRKYSQPVIFFLSKNKLKLVFVW